MLNIREHVDLKQYSSMRVGGSATYFVEVTSEPELHEALTFARKKNIPCRIIGGGYNIIFTDDGFDGLLIKSAITGFEIVDDTPTSTTLKIGAGELWDTIVAKTVDMELSGIEALSLIPSTVGAAPIQNIGAYGQELSSTLVELQVYDTAKQVSRTLTNSECAFTYRSSIFKNVTEQTLYITSITLRLSKKPTITRPLYADLEAYFTEHNITEPTPANIRAAVIAVRSAKLPNPETIANTGSFFGNPIITQDAKAELIAKYPEFENWTSKLFNKKSQSFWDMPDGKVKVSAGMLLEHAGFADYHDEQTGMATWKKQSLVLINEHAKTASDVFAFRDHIISTVQKHYGITLEQEPETI